MGIRDHPLPECLRLKIGPVESSWYVESPPCLPITRKVLNARYIPCLPFLKVFVGPTNLCMRVGGFQRFWGTTFLLIKFTSEPVSTKYSILRTSPLGNFVARCKNMAFDSLATLAKFDFWATGIFSKFFCAYVSFCDVCGERKYFNFSDEPFLPGEVGSDSSGPLHWLPVTPDLPALPFP